MKQDDYCSRNCPYLRKVPKSERRLLPFYCELFRVFLGVENDNPCRCDKCVGKPLNVQKDGYHLISTYPQSVVDKRKTKWGFRRLPLAEKGRFIRLVEQSGVTLGIAQNEPLHTANVLRMLGKQMDILTLREKEERTFRTKEIMGLLNKVDADFPRLLDSETKNLLSNIYAVLDNSEKDLMKQVLSDSKQVEGFVKSVQKMPKGDNLVKDVRRVLDETKKQMDLEEEERKKFLINARAMGRGGR